MSVFDEARREAETKSRALTDARAIAAELSLETFREWLFSELAPPSFKPKDSCQCPIGRFLSARGRSDDFEVGDDDVSFDGTYLCELAPWAKSIVQTVDLFTDEISLDRFRVIFKHIHPQLEELAANEHRN